MAAFIGGLKCSTRLSSQCRHTVHRNILFSVQASVAVDNKLQRFRTLENNPLCHTQDHTGKYYCLPEELKEKLFLTGGIPQSLEMQMKTFNESCIMVREASLEIISYLKNLNYSLPPVRFVIYGDKGVGKTCTLIHLLHFAHQSKYLLLHVPWASNWTKRPKEVVVSQFKPERVDLPLVSALWLQHFKLQNSQLLKELKLNTTQSYSWSKREVTEEGQPITDIIEHGINRMRHASDCVAVLLKEIKNHSKSGRFKTLVVIDGVNAFYSPTNVRKPDKTLAKVKDFTIVRAFEKLFRTDWTNAAVVATVDGIIISKETYKEFQTPYTPLALLGKEGFEALDPFIPVLMENYTNKEIESNLDYFVDRQWLQNEEADTEEGRLQLKFLSGHNPYSLMKICDPL